MYTKIYNKDDCFWHQKCLLKIFGLSPPQNVFYNYYSVILLTLLTIFPFLEAKEIPNILNDINELIYSMLFKIGYCTCLSIIYTVFFNRYRISNVFKKNQSLTAMSDKLMDNNNSTLRECEISIRRQSYIGTGLIASSLACLIGLSMIVSRNRKKWVYPFGFAPDFNNTNLELLVQSTFYFTIGFLFLSITVIYLNLLLLISCHCKILQKCFKELLKNSYKNFSKSREFRLVPKNGVPWDFIKPELGKVVEYHVGILEMAHDIEKAFYIVALAIFTGMSADLCIAIYHMLSLPVGDEKVLKDIVLLFITYFSMTIPSYRGQQVVTESEKIMKVCCQIDFIGTDIRFQKSLMMIINKSQKSITPTIGKTKILCLSTMVGVFQTTYSFYTFLRNVKVKI